MDSNKFYNYLCENYSNMVDFSEKLFRENEKQYEKNLLQLNASCDFSELNPFDENAYLKYLLKQISLTYNDEQQRQTQLNETQVSIRAFKRNQKKCILEGRYDEYNLNSSKELCLNWIDDITKLNLYDYAFLEKLKPHVQVSCIIKSYIYIFFTEGDAEDTSKMMFFPDEVLEEPLFYVGMAKLKPLHTIDRKNNKINYYYENQTSDGHTVRYTREISLLEDINIYSDEELEQLAESNALANSIVQFDTFDWSVYTLFYQLVNLDICNTSTGVFDIDELIDKLPSDSNLNSESAYQRQELARARGIKKQKLYNSLYKFQNYNVHITHISSSGKNEPIHNRPLMITAFSWYQNVVPEDRPGLLGKVVIQFELSFLERWLNRQTDTVLDQMVTEEDYVSVSTQTKQLMFFFQRERIRSLNNNMCTTLFWTYIKERFPYGGKNPTLFRSMITSCLDEFRLKNILISDYVSNRSNISINFLPLSDAERKAYNL